MEKLHKIPHLPRCEEGRGVNTMEFYVKSGFNLYICKDGYALKYEGKENIMLTSPKTIELYLGQVSDILADIFRYKQAFGSKGSFKIFEPDLDRFQHMLSEYTRDYHRIMKSKNWLGLVELKDLSKDLGEDLKRSEVFIHFSFQKYSDLRIQGITEEQRQKYIFDRAVQEKVKIEAQQIKIENYSEVISARQEVAEKLVAEHKKEKEDLNNKITQLNARNERITDQKHALSNELQRLKEHLETQEKLYDEYVNKLKEEISNLKQQIKSHEETNQKFDKMAEMQTEVKSHLEQQFTEMKTLMTSKSDEIYGIFEMNLNQPNEPDKAIDENEENKNDLSEIKLIYQEVYGEEEPFEDKVELELNLENKNDQKFIIRYQEIKLPTISVLSIYHLSKFDFEVVKSFINKISEVTERFMIDFSSGSSVLMSKLLSIILSSASKFQNNVELRWFEFSENDLKETFIGFKHITTLQLNCCVYNIREEIDFEDELNGFNINTITLMNGYVGQAKGVESMFEKLSTALGKVQDVKNNLKQIKLNGVAKTEEQYEYILKRAALDHVEVQLLHF